MTVSATDIADDLKAVYDQMNDPEDIKDSDWFAEQMGIVFKAAILSAAIITSTPGAQAGATTLPGSGTIS